MGRQGQRRTSLGSSGLEDGYFADGLWGDAGTAVEALKLDKSLRPNQLLLLYLGLVPMDKARLILENIEKYLLIPGAVRTLADKKFDEPQHICSSTGCLLVDPYYIYRGTYEGDEDTARKVAYHNGTAWLWLYPYFAEGLGLCLWEYT